MSDVVCKTLQNLSSDLFRAYDHASLTFELSEAVEGTFPFTVSFSDSVHWYQGRITVLGRTFVADGDLFLDFLKDAPDMDPYPMTIRLETRGKTYEGVMHLPNPWKHSTPGETPARASVPLALDWTFEEVNRLGPGSVYGFALWGGEMLAVGGDSYCEDEGEEGFIAWCESGTKLAHPAQRAHGLRRPWVDGKRIYIPGEHGLLATSDDRGASWSLVDLEQDCSIYRITADPRGGLIATTEEGILQSLDGKTWQWLIEDASVRAVCFTKTRAVFCGDDVVIQEEDQHHPPEECEHAETLFAITRMPKSGALIMVGDGGQVFRSRDEGDTWKQLQSPNDEEMEIEDCINVGDGLLVVGADGLMAYSADEGESWHSIKHPWGDTHLRVLTEGDRNGEVWVGGDGGLVATIQTDTDSGADLD